MVTGTFRPMYGGKRKPEEIEAVLTEHLAVHHNLSGIRGWEISHCASGRRIIDNIPSEKKARALAKALEAVGGTDWEFSTLPDDSTLSSRVGPVLKEHLTLWGYAR